MNAPQKYDPIIEFVKARTESIKRNPINSIADRAVLIELEGVITVCQQLNRLEAMVAETLHLTQEVPA